MESALRSALVAALGGDPQLAALLNAVVEEGPSPAPPPALALVASAGTDWSSKTSTGREIRVALELTARSDEPGPAAAIAARIEQCIATLAPQQDGFRIVTTAFLRSRTERRARSARAILLEYAFRVIADQ